MKQLLSHQLQRFRFMEEVQIIFAIHRISVTEKGVHVFPTLSFDERGHQLNDTIYFVEGMDGKGNAPKEFYPELDVFTGNGGNLEHPRALYEMKNDVAVKAGYSLNGQEALGGLKFEEATLNGGETAKFVVFTGLCGTEEEISVMLYGDFWTAVPNLHIQNIRRSYRNR